MTLNVNLEKYPHLGNIDLEKYSHSLGNTDFEKYPHVGTYRQC